VNLLGFWHEQGAIKIRKFLALLTILPMVLFSTIASIDSAYTAGGFFLRVLPDSSKEWSDNSKLWVVAVPGEQSSRRFTVSNTTNQRIDVNLKLGGAQILNGLISFDKDAKLRSEGYASFSENPVRLAPDEQKVIEVIFSPPTGTESFAEDGYLVASIAGKDVSSKSGLQVVIPTVYQYAFPMFVGIGSYAAFRSDFEILDVDGYINSKGNALKVFLKNTGRIPILLNGDVSFQDSTFGGPVLGPFEFSTSRISPGQTAFAAVQLPETITETKWKIFTKASVGINTKTRIFEKDLSFTGVSLFTRAIQVLLAIVSFLGLLWSWRQFRPSKGQGLPENPSTPKKRLWNRARKRKEPEVDDLDFDTDAVISKLMEEIRAESDKALGASKVKVATQRKPAKKVVTQGKKVVKGAKK
jgi:hypothetical protein